MELRPTTAQEAGKEDGRPVTICVFSGAASTVPPSLMETAHATGRLIGERGHQLVYGGGGLGLMGEVAWTASKHGAPVIGVIPKFLYERELGIAAPLQESKITETLHDRKMKMMELADAFLALPGGYGTLDEVLDAISAQYLGLSDKPLVLLNTGNVWDGFVTLIDTLTDIGLITSRERPMFDVAFSPQEAMELIEARVTHAKTAQSAA